MKLSLRFKLTAAFLALTVVLFLIVGVLANALLERQFAAYVTAKQQRMIEDTVDLIASRYNSWGGKWDGKSLESIGMSALGDGLMVRLEGRDGAVVWDAMAHNGGMCAAILEDMAGNMTGRSPGFRGGYTEQSRPVVVGGETVGTAHVGYYGPYFFNDNDLNFLETLNRLLLCAALVASAGSAAFGLVMARRLSEPIDRVTGAARRIAGGDFAVRVTEPSSTRETVALTHAINTLAETLGRQEALRKRLTADVAHELRTPLATVQSHLEAMIDGIWQPDAQRLGSLHEETQRINKLVGDLEKLAMFESEGLALDKTPVELSSVLQRVVTNFQGQFLAAGVALEYQPHEAWVMADEDKLSQVFINLVSNALKYTPAGGIVAVSVHSREGRAEVAVRDTGIGIPAEDLPHIFERFYRTDRSRSRRTGGAGIGLTIAKSIVEAHGGRIHAESEPGRGSLFTVSLPAC